MPDANEPAASASGPVIRELTPELLPDYIDFFEQAAFTDNPHWAQCYCMFYHVAGTDAEWEARTGAENRASKSELVRAGRAQGLLAYVDGRPVGWCNATPRIDLPRIVADEDLHIDDAENVGSIVCFIVAPAYRQQGLARRLLEAACEQLRRRGMRTVEAYAVKDPKNAAQAYHGTLAMYLETGFQSVRDLGTHVIVRKSL